jgi:hypothetical protein
MGAPRDDIRLLSIFHYALAALAGLVSLLPLLHIATGLAFVHGTFGLDLPAAQRTPPPPPLLGWVLLVAGVALMATGLTYTVLLLVTARSLASHRRWTLCMVVSAVSCAFFPLGTALGVFTVVVLAKVETQQLFGRHAGEGSSPGDRSPAPPPA